MRCATPGWTLRGVRSSANASPLGVHGHVDPAFVRVAELLSKYTAAGRGPGGAVCVYQHGEKLVDIWSGTRDAAGSPWQADTMSVSFSTTKGVTSTALHIAAERGLVSYDEPVASYWPEFAANGKERITIREVLTHRSGMHRIAGLTTDPNQLLDWEFMTSAIASSRACPHPKGAPGYHGMTYGWLIGEVIRRVTGSSLGSFVRAELAAPLGADCLNIGVAEADRGRVAQLRPPLTDADLEKSRNSAEKGLNSRLMRRTVEALYAPGWEALARDPSQRATTGEIPAVNGAFTASALARVYMMLANRGELDGVRLLSPERVREISTIQTRQRDYVVRLRMNWRLGYHKALLFGRRSPTAFGHFGFGGSGAFADPDLGLAVGFVTCDMRSTSTPFADVRMARIGAAARRAAMTRRG